MSEGSKKVLTRKHEKFRFFAIFQQIIKIPHKKKPKKPKKTNPNPQPYS